MATMVTAIRYNETLNRHECSEHGTDTVTDRRCWRCEGVQPGCAHPMGGAVLRRTGLGDARWQPQACAACLAAREDQARAARRVTEQAAHEREAQRLAALRSGEVAMVARYNGRCAQCDGALHVGDQIAYNRQTRTARHLLNCRTERAAFTCRYCGERTVNSQATFGGALCPMSPDGEQPHRA